MLENQSDTPALHQQIASNRTARIVRRLMRAEWLMITAGLFAVLVHAGFIRVPAGSEAVVNGGVFAAMAWLTTSRLCRYYLIAGRPGLIEQFFQSNLVVPAIWVCGLVLLRFTEATTLFGRPSLVLWSDLAVGTAAAFSVLAGCRLLAMRAQNSAVLLMGSFAVVITVGTLLLKLPACRALTADGALLSAPWSVALFTATSASCVTGLIVEPTGSYWSPLGHVVIFSLFQIGGLGILTFGAFIAVLSGRRGLQFREARTLRDMLDSQTVRDSRRLLQTILLFTIFVESIGALLLMNLRPEQPLPTRLWESVFHSVSAFCNAGFSLNDDGFLNMGTRWQVWGPLSALIILGGLGFPVINDMWNWGQKKLTGRAKVPLFHTSHGPVRLSLHSRLVLVSTVALLVFGAVSWFALESLEAPAGSSITRRLADSWFQSVTFRTAGFNTVDHAQMHPASKLLAIFLMFVGAAPGSTGGGVKTVVFAVTVLNIWAVFRGRDRVEVFGRSIPTAQVSRSLLMIAVGILTVMIAAGLLVIFERQPDRFLDHLFEATSAFGTVGVSAGVTHQLSMPSRMLICAVMFLGRVGPITLMLAMATSSDAERYRYPEERISLG